MTFRFIKVLGFLFRYMIYRGFRKTDSAQKVIIASVQDLGGLYVKLIQFIALRTDIFSDAEKMKFLSFYDAVLPDDLDVITILRNEIGSDKVAQFTFIHTLPFASGTFGQVYLGKLKNGSTVVIKVQRPGLKYKLMIDFFVLKVSAILFNFIYYQRIIDVHQLLKEFQMLTYKELDYREEVKNALYFHNAYRNHPYVSIPFTYAELSTQKVLVQEFIDGITLTEIIKKKWSQETVPFSDEELREFINRVAYTLGMQGFTESIFYADPHPGNIKLLPDNKIAFIDFGIVGASPSNRRTYYQILELITEAADRLDMNKIGHQFLQWGARTFYKHIESVDSIRTPNHQSLVNITTQKYSELLEEYRERFRYIEIEEGENFSKMFLDIIRAGEILGVKIPEGMLATMRTIAVYKSWATIVDPGWHRMRSVYREVLSTVEKSKIYNADELHPAPVLIEEALESVFDWISGVAEKDYVWFSKVNRELYHSYA